MSQLISGLAGAGGAASNVGGYYTNAANMFSGTQAPVLRQYTAEMMGSLRPQYTSMLDQAAASAAATGLAGSGAGTQYLGNAEAQNAATLTGAVAPAYLQAMQDYAGIISQMPGAQAQAYQQAINNFYTGISDAASMAAGMPPTAQPTQAAPLDMSGGTPWGQYTPPPDYYGSGSSPYSSGP